MAQLSIKVNSTNEAALRAIVQMVQDVVNGMNAIGIRGKTVSIAEASMQENTGGRIDFGMVSKDQVHLISLREQMPRATCGAFSCNSVPF